MKTVWKYEFRRGEPSQTLQMPEGAFPLRVGLQGTSFCLWACVCPDNALEQRNFTITGTGHPVLLCAKYIGSISEGPFEWHVWED